MNNSKLALDSIGSNVSLTLEEKVDNTDTLMEREGQVVKIIEALEGIKQSVEWSTLKSLVFDSRIESIERQLKSEAEKPKLDDSEIYRLQGKLYEAKKYDLDKLIETYRVVLSQIRKTYN